MNELDNILTELLEQQQASKQLRLTLGREKIKTLLKSFSYDELVILIDEVYAEEFAKGEIATHHTEQQGALL